MKKHIPNILTCCNLISGCIATCFAFFHSPDQALTWIIIGAVFDFFDGMSARALHVSSPIGKELDSLADDVTFGVAPSTILLSQLLVMDFPLLPDFLVTYLPFVAYVMAAFSALRLAKFNLDERHACQRPFLGFSHRLCRQLFHQLHMGRLRPYCDDACKLLASCIRNTHVCA